MDKVKQDLYTQTLAQIAVCQIPPPATPFYISIRSQERTI